MGQIYNPISPTVPIGLVRYQDVLEQNAAIAAKADDSALTDEASARAAADTALAEADANLSATVIELDAALGTVAGDVSSRALQSDLENIAGALGATAGQSAQTAAGLESHRTDTTNPHAVTYGQVGAYSVAQVNSLLAGKAASSHTHTVSQISDLSTTYLPLAGGSVSGVTAFGGSSTGHSYFDANGDLNTRSGQTFNLFNSAGASVLSVNTGSLNTAALVSSATVTASGGLRLPGSGGNSINNPNSGTITLANTSFAPSTGTAIPIYINPTDATTSTAAITAFAVNLSGTGAGSGAKLLADLQTAGASKWKADTIGNTTQGGTLTTADTIAFKPSGVTRLQMYLQSGSHPTLSLHNAAGTGMGSWYYYSPSDAIFFDTSSYTKDFYIDAKAVILQNGSGRRVLIGTATDDGTNKLQVAGSITSTGTFKPGTLNTTTTPGTVAGQLCISSVTGKASQWDGSAWQPLW